MKKAKLLCKNLILIFLFISWSLSSSSQIKTLGEFFAGGVSDAEKLFEAYITPWANAIGTSLSGGWYNTAKPHKPGGFDLTITTNMAFVPDDAKTFDLAELGLSNNARFQTANSIAPTVAGETESGPEIDYYLENIPVSSISTPQGTGVGLWLSPMAQIGIGLFKGTEINFRLMPRVEIGKYGKLGLWGIGGKHSIKQWIPAIKKLPVLQLSVMGGYTKFTSSFNISVTPENLDVADQTSTVSFANQSMDLTIKSFTANILVSANLPVVCFYGGLGIVNTKTNLLLSGYYPIPTIYQSQPAVRDESAAEDPIDLEIENNDGKPTKPRLNIGMRIKLGVLTIHGDYTYAHYSNVTAGVGLSVR
jgi:hypothetical protein